MNRGEIKKIYQFEDFILNARNRNFSHFAKTLKLSSRAFDILEYLIQRRGEIASKDEILEVVWNDSFVEEGNLAVHISALRKIFNERQGGKKFIKTISGRGYSFVAPVRETEHLPENLKPEATTVTQHQPRSLFDDKVALAVLPFGHSRTSEDFDYLSDGITQSLIDRLAQIPGLKVMSFSSVAAYKNTVPDLPEIGYLLNVEKFLIGYISEFQNRFEINIELVNSDDGSQMWGTQYDFQLNDFFRIKNEISQKITEKLQIKLSKNEKPRRLNTAEGNSEAYKLYLKGKYLLETYQFSESYREGLNRALDFFRQSIDEDPNYAPAYVGLARVYHNYNVYSLISRREAYNKYDKYICAALKLDPNLSDGYVCKGVLNLIFQPDLVKAQKSFMRAIEINPNNARAYNFLSITLACLSKFDEAVEFQKTALELNPTSTVFNTGLADRLFLTGNYEEAIAQAEDSLELNHRSILALFILARSYARLGMFERALGYAEKAEELESSEEILLLKSYLLHLNGKTADSARLLDKVLSNPASQNIDYADVARVYAISGAHEKALEFLERSYFEGSETIVFLNVDLDLAVLRGHPKFDELLSRMNIPH